MGKDSSRRLPQRHYYSNLAIHTSDERAQLRRDCKAFLESSGIDLQSIDAEGSADAYLQHLKNRFSGIAKNSGSWWIDMLKLQVTKDESTVQRNLRGIIDGQKRNAKKNAQRIERERLIRSEEADMEEGDVISVAQAASSPEQVNLAQHLAHHQIVRAIPPHHIVEDENLAVPRSVDCANPTRGKLGSDSTGRRSRELEALADHNSRGLREESPPLVRHRAPPVLPTRPSSGDGSSLWEVPGSETDDEEDNVPLRRTALAGHNYMDDQPHREVKTSPARSKPLVPYEFSSPNWDTIPYHNYDQLPPHRASPSLPVWPAQNSPEESTRPPPPSVCSSPATQIPSETFQSYLQKRMEGGALARNVEGTMLQPSNIRVPDLADLEGKRSSRNSHGGAPSTSVVVVKNQAGSLAEYLDTEIVLSVSKQHYRVRRGSTQDILQRLLTCFEVNMEKATIAAAAGCR